MLSTFTKTSLATLVAASFSFGAVAGDYDKDNKRDKYDDKTVVEVLDEKDRFSKFSEALDQADMEDKLEDGNYTVFAPTNQAFERLPDDTWDQWMDGENQDELREVLSYHVVEERVASDDISESEEDFSSMNGNSLQLSSSYGSAMVNDVRVVHSDIEAENGYIHGINEVLMDNDERDMRTSAAY
jgi:uncharacterized surface protein with fasciclin (FAS1) repeats